MPRRSLAPVRRSVPTRSLARTLAVVGALLGTAFTSAAHADADVAISASSDADVSAAWVAEALARARPGLTVIVPLYGDPSPAASEVRIDRADDGLVVVALRDLDGRYGARVVDPGDSPERTVAKVVLQLLDTLAGPSTRSPAEDEAQPPPRPSRPIATAALAFGVGTRDLTVEGRDSSSARWYEAPPFGTIAFGATVHPGRAWLPRGPLTWIGVTAHLARDLTLNSRGPTDLGESIELETDYQDAAVGALIDVPLTTGPAGPKVRASVGWSELSFELDPIQTSLLKVERQTPSFVYQGVLASVEGHIPLGDTGFELTTAVRYFEALDVGQAVRDAFGDDTQGASGLGLHASLRRQIVPRLDATVAFQLRRLQTTIAGRNLNADELFRSATDRYADVSLALSYSPW